MPVYSAADIVGATLVAAKEIYAYQYPKDDSPVVGKFLPGQSVGVVAGYVEAKPEEGRNYLYWMFNDAYGNVEYWVRHSADSFHYDNLTQQGVQDVMTQIEQQNLANLPWYERLIKSYGVPLLVGVGIIYLAGSGVKGYFSRPK